MRLCQPTANLRPMTEQPPSAKAGSGVWKQHAQQWQRIGTPLRPSTEDGQLMLELAAPALAGQQTPGVVILGVTPELVQLPWPADARVLALDQSAEMIASIWQPHPGVESRVREARWQTMPVENGSISLIVGDGSLNALTSLQEYPEVFTEAARALKPEGALVLRCFVRPDRAETPDAVATAVLAGDVGSMHALKWRIAMALEVDHTFSVAVVDIRAAFDRLFPDRDRLARITGWARQTIDTIDAYQDVATRYSFPTLAAIRTAAAPHFEVGEVRSGRYELAERCPTVLFRKSAGIE